jgi:hypothetical protein
VRRDLDSPLRRLGFVPLEMDAGDEVEIGPASAVGSSGSACVCVKAVPADHAGTRYPRAAQSLGAAFPQSSNSPLAPLSVSSVFAFSTILSSVQSAGSSMRATLGPRS